MSETVLNLGPSLSAIPTARRLATLRAWELPSLAAKFELLADAVEYNSPDLPAPIRRLATVFAYQEMEDSKKPSILARLQFALFTFRNITAKDDIVSLLSAMTRLNDAVFSAIERESSEYRRSVDQALASAERGAPMSAQQFRAWTRDLS